MAEVAITFRCSQELQQQLTAEMTKSNFKSLNKYVPTILQDPRVVEIRTGKKIDPVDTSKLSSEIEKLKREKQDLESKLDQLKKSPPKVETKTVQDDKLLKHVIKRAWEISRISEEQLMKGYSNE